MKINLTATENSADSQIVFAELVEIDLPSALLLVDLPNLLEKSVADTSPLFEELFQSNPYEIEQKNDEAKDSTYAEDWREFVLPEIKDEARFLPNFIKEKLADVRKFVAQYLAKNPEAEKTRRLFFNSSDKMTEDFENDEFVKKLREANLDKTDTSEELEEIDKDFFVACVLCENLPKKKISELATSVKFRRDDIRRWLSALNIARIFMRNSYFDPEENKEVARKAENSESPSIVARSLRIHSQDDCYAVIQALLIKNFPEFV